jgi:hypothetical protein
MNSTKVVGLGDRMFLESQEQAHPYSYQFISSKPLESMFEHERGLSSTSLPEANSPSAMSPLSKRRVPKRQAAGSPARKGRAQAKSRNQSVQPAKKISGLHKKERIGPGSKGNSKTDAHKKTVSPQIRENAKLNSSLEKATPPPKKTHNKSKDAKPPLKSDTKSSASKPKESRSPASKVKETKDTQAQQGVSKLGRRGLEAIDNKRESRKNSHEKQFKTPKLPSLQPKRSDESDLNSSSEQLTAPGKLNGRHPSKLSKKSHELEPLRTKGGKAREGSSVDYTPTNRGSKSKPTGLRLEQSPDDFSHTSSSKQARRRPAASKHNQFTDEVSETSDNKQARRKARAPKQDESIDEITEPSETKQARRRPKASKHDQSTDEIAETKPARRRPKASKHDQSTDEIVETSAVKQARRRESKASDRHSKLEGSSLSSGRDLMKVADMMTSAAKTNHRAALEETGSLGSSDDDLSESSSTKAAVGAEIGSLASKDETRPSRRDNASKAESTVDRSNKSSRNDVNFGKRSKPLQSNAEQSDNSDDETSHRKDDRLHKMHKPSTKSSLLSPIATSSGQFSPRARPKPKARSGEDSLISEDLGQSQTSLLKHHRRMIRQVRELRAYKDLGSGGPIMKVVRRGEEQHLPSLSQKFTGEYTFFMC